MILSRSALKRNGKQFLKFHNFHKNIRNLLDNFTIPLYITFILNNEYSYCGVEQW